MIDIKLIREDLENTIKALSRRGQDYAYLKEVYQLDEQKRKLQQEADVLKADRNARSKEIGMKKGRGENVEFLFAELASIGDRIDNIDKVQAELEEKIHHLLAHTPNIPDSKIKDGKDSADNRVVRVVGEVKPFSFKPQPHWDLATNLDILDFERASKITGARFVLYKGEGARLERALINFMLDIQGKAGYKEIIPPLMVNSDSAYGTGNLPKFEEDLFKVKEGYYLIPTAEIPVTNIHRNEIVKEELLPIKYTAYTPCFREEAGSAGKDTRGIIRLHQFNKIEVVKFAHPDKSMEELETLTNDAERILQLLKLPYRVVELCTGDIGFSSAKTYDLEVWLPSYNDYKEISSCSNFKDFQARRLNIRFKNSKTGKNELVHTLNGSGLAVGRTFAAVVENYQRADGSIEIPEVLIPYMNIKEIK